MLTVNMHDAKTRLSELVARAVAGEPFVIARAGKPLVRVEALEPVQKEPSSIIGCLKGQFTMPGDAAWMEMDREIEQMFEDEIARDGSTPSGRDEG